MKYIAFRRLRGDAMGARVNIPAMTEVEERDGFLWHHGRMICAVSSYTAHQHFAPNDDGQGLTRGMLTQAITRRLERRDKQYQDRWDKVWADPESQPLRKENLGDHWIWSHDFYAAPIETLRHIAALVGAKGG